MRKKLLLLLAGFWVGSAPLFSAPPSEIPVETLFQAPAISALTFSPNGKYILCLVPYEKRLNLAVIDLENGRKNLLTNFKDRQVTAPRWASNDRILFHVDDEGKESFSLYGVNRDGKDRAILASGYGKSNSVGAVNEQYVGVLRRLRNDPKKILVLARITHADWLDVATMDLKSGRMVAVARAPGEVQGGNYTLDWDDEVRLVVITDGQERRVLYRDRAGQEWQQIASHQLGGEAWEPVIFDGDNRTLYVWSSMGRATKALYRYDTLTKTMGDMVVGDDTYDVVNSMGGGYSVYFNRAKNKIVGFSYTTERTRFHWLDEETRQIHQRMEHSLPGLTHEIAQISEDGKQIIFFSSSDRDPGVYYLYDAATQKVSELAVVRPKIDPEQMASMKPISFKARDGLTLHGYLTLPAGREPKNLPLVIHPHGGPYGPRDEWGYNQEVQLYANRGFAVLQVNFRGSGGYGGPFEAAGFKKWGLEMQDDLTDGVKWAIDQGVANPEKVVISGASYGGYAAMAGLTTTPDLYCAGINYVGVVNIEDLIPKTLPASRMYWMKTRIADLGKSEERKRVYETSPVHFAHRIKAPLLMAYGRNDPRVPISHAFDIEKALKKAGRPYELIIEDDEGHGFRKEEKAIAFYKKIDQFLKKHVLER